MDGIPSTHATDRAREYTEVFAWTKKLPWRGPTALVGVASGGAAVLAAASRAFAADIDRKALVAHV